MSLSVRIFQIEFGIAVADDPNSSRWNFFSAAKRDKPNKAYAPDRPIKKTAKKRRKSTTRWLMEEAFDFIEDIFD